MVNKGQLHEELRYFWTVLQIWSKWDRELKWEIRDFSKLKNTTPRGIHEKKSLDLDQNSWRNQRPKIK